MSDRRGYVKKQLYRTGRHAALATLARAVLAGLTLFTAPTPAVAQTSVTLVSNIGQTTDIPLGSWHERAQAFTTGSNSESYKLSGVDVPFRTVPDSSAYTIRILSSSSGNPGSTLVTLAVGSQTGRTVSWTGSLDLASDTTYFVFLDVLSRPYGGSTEQTFSDSEDSGTAPGWSLGNGSLARPSKRHSWGPSIMSWKIAVIGYAVDTTAPSHSSATVNGRALIVTFDEGLDESSQPAGSAFEVRATPPRGAARTIAGTSTASIAGATVRVTLGAPVVHGEAVTVSYAKPGANRLRDRAATPNEVADFSGESVTNHTPAPPPSDLVPSFGGATIADQSWMVGTPITALALPAATGGDGTLRYRLTPAPPSGLTLIAATRMVTGTPDAPQGAVRYTWTATDVDGDEATLSFTIAVTSGAPTALTLSAAPAPVEGGGEVTVTATLDAPALAGGTTVRLSLSGTAAGTGVDADYTLSSATIAIAEGATEGTATIAVIDDAVDDDAETIVIDAASDTPALSAETLTLTIMDNDEPATPATVRLSALPNPVTEGSSVTVTARLSAPLSSDVTIPVTVTMDTSEADDHGTLAAIILDAGATSGTGTITTAQDDDPDDETFTVALGRLPSGVTAGVPASVQVTIDDGTTPSSDASLRGLLISDGALAFDPAKTSYAVAVAHAVASVMLTPTVNHAGATVAVNGAAVASGTPSGSIPLRVGENPIAVVVTAADGTTRTYRVTVRRGLKILGAAEKEHVDKVGTALLGHDDPGVYPPEGASNR